MHARTGALLAVALVCLAGIASAQTPPQDESRNYLSVSAGVDLIPAHAAVGGEYGERVTPNVHAYFTVTYFDNVMSQDTTDDLADLGDHLTASTGTRWTFKGRDRGVAAVGGARYTFRLSESVRPYIGGGAGALNLDRTITAPPIGDVRLAVFNDYGIGSEELTGESVTRPVVEAVGGIILTPTRRLRLDVGYRIHKGFGFGEDVTFSQVSVGVGYRF